MRWTPDVIERLRELAAAGHTQVQAAILLGAKPSTLGTIASRQKIRFPVKRRGSAKKIVESSRKPARLKNPLKIPPGDFANVALRAEIEAAKREAPTAPLYRGGSWA